MEKFATFTELTSRIRPRREISCSIGLETLLATVFAVAPGIWVITITCGRLASGKRFLGKDIRAMIPIAKNTAITL